MSRSGPYIKVRCEWCPSVSEIPTAIDGSIEHKLTNAGWSELWGKDTCSTCTKTGVRLDLIMSERGSERQVLWIHSLPLLQRDVKQPDCYHLQCAAIRTHATEPKVIIYNGSASLVFDHDDVMALLPLLVYFVAKGGLP